MNTELYNDYDVINQNSYRVMEYNYKRAIRSLIPKGLSRLDFEIIYSIFVLDKKQESYPSKITERRGIKKNHLTIVLKRLQNKKQIEIIQDLEDKRKTYITLTPEGYETAKVVDHFYTKLRVEAVKRIGILSTLNLIRILHKIGNNMSSTDDLPESKLSISKFIEYFISISGRIYHYVEDGEFEFYENENKNLTFNDLQSMIVLYKTSNLPIGEIAKQTELPFTTVNTLIKKLEKYELLQVTISDKDRRVKNISLTIDGEALVERYMTLRINTYRHIMDILNAREEKQLLKGFQIFKEISDDFTID